MKRSRTIALVTMGISALALSACSSATEDVLPARVYTSVMECIADGEFDKDACEAAQFAAVDGYEANYPKFSKISECEELAGEDACEVDRPNSSERSYRPSMAGFIIAAAVSRVQSQAVIGNAGSPSRLGTASGAAIAQSGTRAHVPSAAAARPAAAQVAKAATVARAGFGGSAAAHSSASG